MDLYQRTLQSITLSMATMGLLLAAATNLTFRVGDKKLVGIANIMRVQMADAAKAMASLGSMSATPENLAVVQQTVTDHRENMVGQYKRIIAKLPEGVAQPMFMRQKDRKLSSGGMMFTIADDCRWSNLSWAAGYEGYQDDTDS